MQPPGENRSNRQSMNGSPSPVAGGSLGPLGPFPRVGFRHHLERRWLHYAFVSREPGYAAVANLSVLGSPPEHPDLAPQQMAILVVHDTRHGWQSSQFNAEQQETPWSAFRLPHPHGTPTSFTLRARSGTPAVDLMLTRTSRPCPSQCAPFATDQHLRWQSEPGIRGVGTVRLGDGAHAVELVGYHERVRGCWDWRGLGGGVSGFAVHGQGDPEGAPRAAVVFTLIQPIAARDATAGSVMLWREGRLVRHFPRRTLEVAVRGELDRDRVFIVPPLAATLGTPPTAPVPQRLVITACSGLDWLAVDFGAETAGRIISPSETTLNPFSAHEVLGRCTVEGVVSGSRVRIEADAVVEFAGGAID